MKQKNGFAILGACVALLCASVAHSDQPATSKVGLVAFDEKLQILVGVPEGVPALGYFLRHPGTVYLPGIIDPTVPPSPCVPLIFAWNVIVTRLPAHAQRNALLPVTRNMVKHNCSAIIDFDDGAVPAPIVRMRPVAQ